MLSTAASKLPPVRSSLLTNARRGTFVPIGLTPNRLGLGLHSGNPAKHADGSVQDAQRSLDLCSEVHVAGSVDQAEAVIAPDAGRGSRCDRDAPFALFLQVVHGGGALVDLAHLVAPAGDVQDALGDRRLARIDVRDDPNVPGPQDRSFVLGLAHSIGTRLGLDHACSFGATRRGSPPRKKATNSSPEGYPVKVPDTPRRRVGMVRSRYRCSGPPRFSDNEEHPCPAFARFFSSA